MTLQEDYRVSLGAFEGPLDLLLFLVRRLEVDITDIPLAQITEQYLAFLAHVDEVDVEIAGDFLVMAATLIELKSRTLMPPEPTERRAGGDDSSSDSAMDPRSELIQQLLAYQRFRFAAEQLDAEKNAHARRWPRRPAKLERDDDALPELELEDVHAMDLAEAYERIITSIDMTRLGDHVVEMDETPIALHQEDLLDRLERAPEQRVTLQSTFEGRTPGQRVGLFLATLELARMRRVTVKQDEIEADIELVLLPPEETDGVVVAVDADAPPAD